MIQQTLFQHKNGRSVFVRNGFSWPAFLFGPLWAWVKRQWLLGLLLFLALLPLNMLIEVADSKKDGIFIFASLGLFIGYMLVCGLYGNRWLTKSLKAKGYVEVVSLNSSLHFDPQVGQ